MYICIHVCICICIIYMYTYTLILHIHICIYIYIISIYMHVYVHKYMFIWYMYIDLFVYIDIYTFSSCFLEHCNIYYFVSQCILSHALHDHIGLFLSLWFVVNNVLIECFDRHKTSRNIRTWRIFGSILKWKWEYEDFLLDKKSNHFFIFTSTYLSNSQL